MLVGNADNKQRIAIETHQQQTQHQNHMNRVLVSLQMRASDLIGQSNMDTVFVKSDFSIKFLNFPQISSFTLSSYSVFFSFGRPAFLFSGSITPPSKNLARFQLVKRCTYSNLPVHSLDRSMTPITPSQRYSRIPFWMSYVRSSSLRLATQSSSAIIWSSEWNMCNFPWKLIATHSIIQRSSILSSSFMLNLFQQRSIWLSRSMTDVVLGHTQLTLERLQVLWLRRRKRQLKREIAQQFISFLQQLALLMGKPKTQPVSVSMISQKLPMNLMFRTYRNSEVGRTEGMQSLSMMNLLPCESTKAKWLLTDFSKTSSIFPSHFMRIILNGSAITQQLFTKLMPKVGLYFSQKQPENHSASLLARNITSSVRTSFDSLVVLLKKLKIERFPCE